MGLGIAAHGNELFNLARAVGRWPSGLRPRPVLPTVPSGDPGRDTPVVLVHGYAHNHSAWRDLAAELRRSGYTSVHSLNYSPLRRGVPALASQLADHVDEVLAATGADRVHVVGHSLGGLLLRWYVQELGGDEKVGVAVTLATPHEGTLTAIAALPLGGAARDIVPGADVIARLRAGARPSAVRWVNYYSDVDWAIQPISSGRLTSAAYDATNILVRDRGHVSMLCAHDVIRSIVDQLDGWTGHSASITQLRRNVS